MRVYETIDELWCDALATARDGEYLDSRDGPCFERVGWSGTLVDINYSFLRSPLRSLPPVYASAELLWYLSGESSIEMIKAYAPQYERFAENGVAFGAYGARITRDDTFQAAVFKKFSSLTEKIGPFHQLGQIAAVIRLLKLSPSTRQAIISLWNPGDLIHAIIGHHKDLPCTICLQFLLRDDRLHMVVFMRSNDVWLGLPNDIYCFTCIQRLIADALDVGYGTYTHCVGSLHIYGRDLKNNELDFAETLPHNWDHIPNVLETISNAVEIERSNRAFPENACHNAYEHVGVGNVVADSVYLCAYKHNKLVDYAGYLKSEALKSAYHRLVARRANNADHRGS